MNLIASGAVPGMTRRLDNGKSGRTVMQQRAGLYRTNTGYETYSADHWDLSPVNVVCRAAKRMIAEGHGLSLPSGYTVDTLDQIIWLTGRYGDRVRISSRQVEEIAQKG